MCHGSAEPCCIACYREPGDLLPVNERGTTVDRDNTTWCTGNRPVVACDHSLRAALVIGAD